MVDNCEELRLVIIFVKIHVSLPCLTYIFIFEAEAEAGHAQLSE